MLRVTTILFVLGLCLASMQAQDDVQRVDRTVLRFDPVMTGDSVDTAQTISVPPEPGPGFEIVHQPRPPYTLFYRHPSQPGEDTAVVRVAFEPKTRRRAVDSVVLVYYNDQGQRRDTVIFALRGAGAELPPERQVTFNNAAVGRIAVQDLNIGLPATPVNNSFRYRLDQLTPGPVTGRIQTPIGASNADEVRLRFTCNPTVYADTMQTFRLYRTAEDDPTIANPWDSTLINVRTIMAPRPVDLTLCFEQDTMRQRIGDTITTVITLKADGPIDRPIEIEQLDARFTFNPTLFVPIIGPNQGHIVSGDSSLVSISLGSPLTITGPVTVIDTVRGVVTLGDFDRTTLAFTQAEVEYNGAQPVEITTRDGLLIITNVWRCRDGQARYVNTLRGPLVLDVDPNPVTTNATMRVANVPAQQGVLIVVDAAGQTVANLTDDLRSGTTEWSIASGGGSPLALTPGTYYARLRVDGANGQTIYSVVRLFVVQ